MGRCQVTRAQLQQHLNDIDPQWCMASYDLLTRNCNNFSDEVCSVLNAEKSGEVLTYFILLSRQLCKFLTAGKGIPDFVVNLPDDALNNSILGKLLIRPAIEGAF
jgi:hypothetical protein